MRCLVRLLPCALLVLLSANALASGVVTVASPFPKDLLVAYKQAFDAQHPESRVEFVNFSATNIVSYLMDRAAGSRPDVFWGSSPDSFRALHRHGLLKQLGNLGDPAIPARIGKLNVNNEHGYYRGQALSGYGIMWNKRYLAARGIPAPANWSDLVRPEYFSHVVMSSPSRSSTNHLIIESILQGEGWEAGWAQILQIAANCAMISDRSSGAPNSVTSGRFGVGLVVDFLALSAHYSGFPVEFSYASPSVITPVSIALINGGKNPEGGMKFIEFTLSKEGQSLLLRPAISRLPVLPSVYASEGIPGDYPNLLSVSENYPAAYDADLSEARYLMVGAIFDQVITFRHRELVGVARAIHSAERLLAARKNPEALALIKKARALIYRAPLSEHDELLSNKPLQTRTHIASIAKREAEWARQASSRYAAAKVMAERALALMNEAS